MNNKVKKIAAIDAAVIMRYITLSIFVLMLSACGATRSYRQGNELIGQGKFSEGLAKLEEAVRADPHNAEYRISLVSRRASIVNSFIAAGETARREGRLTEAEKAYIQAQLYDPLNPMARQGLEALVLERRHRQSITEAETLLKQGGAIKLGEALERLRVILSENPNQKEAANLKARIEEERAKESKPEFKLAATYKKPITLEFRDASLKSVFDVIAKVSGLNFFFDKDIRPDLKATILAKDTSVEDAIRLILVTNQLQQKILNENSILIYPDTPQKLKDYQTLVVRTFYLINADVKSVSNTIKTIVKTKDLVIDERLGLIIMRDTPEAIQMAARIVALQDLSDPEVMLEVEVMEVKRSRLLELGIAWPSQLSLSPLVAESGALTLNDLRHLGPSTIKAGVGGVTLNLRKEDQDGNILANPRIRVRNKEKAKVLIGDRVPVITTTSTSTGFVSESVSYVDVGLKLEVEPNVYLDEEVAIKINLEVSNLVREVVSKSGTLSYQIGTRGANTVLRLKDGETQILAGLISDEDRTTANKVPALGDLPLAGRLFGSQKDDNQRSEILLSITPRVVRSIRRADLQAAEFESGTEANIGSTALRLSSGDGTKVAGQNNATTDKPVPGKSGESMTKPEPNPSNKSDAANTSPIPTAAGVPNFSWQMPAKVKVGEQFSAVLRVNSQTPLVGLPLLIGFDPQILQVADVQDGDFLKQSGGQVNFNHRLDPNQGKIFTASVRQNNGNNATGVNGSGNALVVTFKAIKTSTTTTKVQLLSVSPEPAPNSPIPVPLEQALEVVQ